MSLRSSSSSPNDNDMLPKIRKELYNTCKCMHCISKNLT